MPLALSVPRPVAPAPALPSGAVGAALPLPLPFVPPTVAVPAARRSGRSHRCPLPRSPAARCHPHRRCCALSAVTALAANARVRAARGGRRGAARIRIGRARVRARVAIRPRGGAVLERRSVETDPAVARGEHVIHQLDLLRLVHGGSDAAVARIDRVAAGEVDVLDVGAVDRVDGERRVVGRVLHLGLVAGIRPVAAAEAAEHLDAVVRRGELDALRIGARAREQSLVGLAGGVDALLEGLVRLLLRALAGVVAAAGRVDEDAGRVVDRAGVGLGRAGRVALRVPRRTRGVGVHARVARIHCGLAAVAGSAVIVVGEEAAGAAASSNCGAACKYPDPERQAK